MRENAGSAPRAGDLWGGLAAAAIVLPQAMAFGVTLFAIAGLDASAGAYTGLVGSAMLCLASGFAGGTRGLVSAPTGPTLVLLGSALGGLVASGLDAAGIALGLAVTVALTGLLQVVIGASGGGRLIKYIPFPVVSGFMTGAAILMILSQVEPLTGTATDAAWSGWAWLPALAALATIAGTRLAPRFAPRVPGPIAGLVLGTAVFHALAALHPGAPPAAWMIGAVPGFSGLPVGFEPALLGALPWAVIVPAATALAVLASLDTLLTAVVADVATGRRHDSRRELIGQGAGQLAAAAFGGMAGAGTTAATVIAIKSGGGRWVGVAAGVVFLLLTGFAGDAGQLLPIGALAGVILAVAIDVADLDILTWARDGRTRQDAAIAVLVTLITVLYDLMIAVGVGVAIAVLLFIREQITAPVVHRRSTAAQTRSIRSRAERERELLEAHGTRIIVYELRGNLFFGTADRLIDELADDLDGPNQVILDLRKVARIDLTAVRFLEQIANRLAEHGGMLLFCELHAGTGIAGSVAEVFRRTSRQGGSAPVLTFNGRDEALEYAEDALLEALGASPALRAERVPLSDNALTRRLTPAQLEMLGGQLRTRDVAAGDYLFRAGDESDELYLVLRGRIEIRLATTTHHYKRLAVYAPGSFFGELGLLKRGARAADAIAATEATCSVLEHAVFARFAAEDPALAIALLSALCDSLVANQRWSTRELQRLSEW